MSVQAAHPLSLPDTGPCSCLRVGPSLRTCPASVDTEGDTVTIRGAPRSPIADSQGLAMSSRPAYRLVVMAYAQVNGLQLYYERHGSGRPLALLHGGLMTIDLNFGPLLEPLAARRQVIAVELQGHGHTADTDRPITIEAAGRRRRRDARPFGDRRGRSVTRRPDQVLAPITPFLDCI
jgi:hypothetical protein